MALAAPRDRMPLQRLALVWVSAALLAACGGRGPSGPSEAPGSQVLEGRAVDAIDGAAASGVSVRVGGRTSTTDSNGLFRVDVTGPATHDLLVRGTGIVERETTIIGPGTQPAEVSLIPTLFDLDAFNEMFRPNGPLQRWTTRPSIVVLASVMTYTGGGGVRDEYAATAEPLTGEDVQEILTHLEEGLVILTGGTYSRFASVEIERPAAHDRVSVTRPGKIVMGRYNGIVTHSNTIGYGQWALLPDGSVGSGAMFLDRGFDKNSERRRLLRIHELGHALGLMHVTTRNSVMNPTLGPDVTEFDRAAATIAFKRPPRNRAPDIDPAGAPTSRSANRTLTWAPPVFCR